MGEKPHDEASVNHTQRTTGNLGILIAGEKPFPSDEHINWLLANGEFRKHVYK